MSPSCHSVCGGGVPEGTMLLAQLSAGFQSLPPLPTSKLGPSGADSQMGGLVYVLGPCGSLQQLSCEAGSFSCHHNLHRCFQSEVLRLYFPTLEPWVAWSVSLPSCCSWLSAGKCGTAQSFTCCLAARPLSPGFLCLPLLPVWMNVSSLTPWLSDFLTVRFSGSSGYILFLNWLLSFFWLC